MSQPKAAPSPGTDEPSPFRYQHDQGFPALLEQLSLSLAVTTYQAGKLMLVRAAQGRLSTLLRSFEQPMGLAVDAQLRRMVVGTRRMVWTLTSEPQIAPQLEPQGRHDACWVPRQAHVTGDVRGHEIVFADGKVWLVNTLLSCLCTFDDERFGFVPRWKPPFIDRLAAEDRCHLNGVAVEEGQLRYVTALGMTNQQDGWKPEKVRGGVLLHVPSGEVVAQGLCMPHSPRCFRGNLLVLNSGEGQLCRVDPATGKVDVIAALPGYARGLAYHGKYAFVGLSQIREKHIFGGLPIADRHGEAERQCGIHAIDLVTGKTVGFLQFTGGCTELFDIQVLPGQRWPSVIGFQEETLDGILVAPPGAWAEGVSLPLAE